MHASVGGAAGDIGALVSGHSRLSVSRNSLKTMAQSPDGGHGVCRRTKRVERRLEDHETPRDRGRVAGLRASGVGTAGAVQTRVRPFRRADGDDPARRGTRGRGGGGPTPVPSRRPNLERRLRSSRVPVRGRLTRPPRQPREARLRCFRPGLRSDGPEALVGWALPPKPRGARCRRLRDRDARRPRPVGRAGADSLRRGVRRDEALRLRGRGGAQLGPPGGARPRGRESIRPGQRCLRTGSALRSLGSGRLRSVERPAGERDSLGGQRPPRPSAQRSLRSSPSWSATAPGTSRQVWVRSGGPTSRRLAPLLGRPLGLDRVRVDMGPARVVGMGDLALRELGLLGLSRVVLASRPPSGPRRGSPGPCREATSVGAPETGTAARSRSTATTRAMPFRAARRAAGGRSPGREHLGSRDRAHRQLGVAGTPGGGALQVLDPARTRLGRDVRPVDASHAVVREASDQADDRRHRPRLRTDPMTTIPAPVARRRMPGRDDRGSEQARGVACDRTLAGRGQRVLPKSTGRRRRVPRDMAERSTGRPRAPAFLAPWPPIASGTGASRSSSGGVRPPDARDRCPPPDAPGGAATSSTAGDERGAGRRASHGRDGAARRSWTETMRQGAERARPGGDRGRVAPKPVGRRLGRRERSTDRAIRATRPPRARSQRESPEGFERPRTTRPARAGPPTRSVPGLRRPAEAGSTASPGRRPGRRRPRAESPRSSGSSEGNAVRRPRRDRD